MHQNSRKDTGYSFDVEKKKNGTVTTTTNQLGNGTPLFLRWSNESPKQVAPFLQVPEKTEWKTDHTLQWRVFQHRTLTKAQYSRSSHRLWKVALKCNRKRRELWSVDTNFEFTKTEKRGLTGSELVDKGITETSDIQKSITRRTSGIRITDIDYSVQTDLWKTGFYHRVKKDMNYMSLRDVDDSFGDTIQCVENTLILDQMK